MPIVPVNSTTFSNLSVPGSGFNTTCTLVGQGSSRFVFAAFSNRFGGVPLDAVTFNGLAMSQLGVILSSAEAGWRLFLYGLAIGNLAAGDYNFFLNTNGGGGDTGVGGVSWYDGVDQLTPTGTAVLNQLSGSGTDTSPTVEIPSAIDDLLVGAMVTNVNDGAVTDGTLTRRWTRENSASNDDCYGFEKAGAAGNVVFAPGGLGTAEHWMIGGVSLKPAVAPVIKTDWRKFPKFSLTRSS